MLFTIIHILTGNSDPKCAVRKRRVQVTQPVLLILKDE
jgi:hypothetical protein